MMKTTILLSTLAFAAMTSPAWAQSSGQTPPARSLSTVDAQELKASATGRSFDVGGTRFQLSPSTTVQQAAGGQFRITPQAAATTSSRSKRSLDGAAAAGADAGAGKFAAAVSNDGAPVVSKAAGLAIVEYPSVNAALDASTRLLSTAGVRAAEPDVVQWEEKK
jgi:hypothetical protein